MASMDEATKTLLEGQAEIWKQMFSFVDSMALKCAVELRIPDIIHSHNRPLTLSEIASNITTNSSSTPNIACLSRIMRLLVRKKIFTSAPAPSPPPTSQHGAPFATLYGQTPASRWLLMDTDGPSLAPLLLMQTDPWMLSPWHQLSSCVREGGIGIKKAHGCDLWDLASRNPKLNEIFNAGMRCTSEITVDAMISGFDEGAWDGLESLVDVGGGTGLIISEIVKAFPHIKGINFDLPHVIANAPKYDGVSHVVGDMFEAIPSAHAVLMKWIMHDWGDDDCVRILNNCRRAIPEKTGKIFIVDVVLSPEGDGLFDTTRLALDMVMITHTGGMERTESEWKDLLEKGGFPRYKITRIPSLYSIIEAYPN